MKILAIGAHADDVELGCGGTLVKAVKGGHDVRVIITSDSSYINYDGTVMRTREVADKEAYDALEVLGVPQSKVDIFEFPAKDVPYDSTSVEAINKILDEYKPDLILTHWTFDTHQSHRNTALATISAARNFNNILMYEPFPPSGRSYVAYRPQVYVDVTGHMEAKVKSLEAHVSQFHKYGNDWIESIEGRARLRGFESGCKYAETFEVLRYNLEFKL